jgi:uncharacterized protein YndB with AHSA1/START domain
VFKAWTDPDQLAKWWGPEGFETPRESVNIELRAGGRFDKVMVIASAEIAAGMQLEVGAEFPDHSEIVEVVEPELLVVRHEAQPELGLPVATETRIEFEDDGDGRTRVTITDGPYTSAMQPNAEAGWGESLGKLERLLPSV